jgi:hypothetical protein
MDTITISPGQAVVITDAAGQEHPSEALSDVESEGHSFPIVWVQRPLADGGTEPTPWPADSVRPA